MQKDNPTFILELKLSVECWQHHILHKRFEMARKLYNTLLSYALKQLQLMRESKVYRQHIHDYHNTKALLAKNKTKVLKKHYQQELSTIKDGLNAIRKSFQLSQYGLHGVIGKHQRHVKMHIDSFTGQKIADAVWRSIQDVIFKGSRAHFKKYGTLASVEGKWNKSGIRFKQDDNILYWNGLKLPAIIRENDLFAHEALASHRIKYCRIIKKVIRGRNVFYLQLVMDGTPPPKRVKATGMIRHKATPSGRVGIDIGMSTVAVSSETEVFLKPLAPKVPLFDQEKRSLHRKLDRSKRSMNPHNFNADGTIKRGIKLTWKRSNTYMKTLYLLKELHRKRSAYVKVQHGKIANHVLTLGDTVYVEKMSFMGLAKRAKVTKKNKNGKFLSKKRFGKSISSYAPALLMRIIEQKLKYIEKEIHEINTYTFKASQYNHVTDTFKRKKLHQRWSYIGNHKIQRDLYSAFLIMNSQIEGKKTNREYCKRTFENFLTLHDNQMEQLKRHASHFPSSMGLKEAI